MIDLARQRRESVTPDDVLPPRRRGRAAGGRRSRRRPGGRAAHRAARDSAASFSRRRRGSGTTSRRSPDNDIVVGIGPAGTGKTYLAVATAVDALARKRVQRIVLARPAVEAGETLGFLPGDLQAKVDPYLRPLYDALEDMMPHERVQRALETRDDRDRAARVHARPHARATRSSSWTRRRTRPARR